MAWVSGGATHRTGAQYDPSSLSQVMYGDMENSTVYIPNVQGNCVTFGCNISYDSKHSCQCNSECDKFGNCCSDYKSHCLDSHAGCNIYGCNISYERGNACQCDADCWKYPAGCCSDWNSLCAHQVRLREMIALLLTTFKFLVSKWTSAWLHRPIQTDYFCIQAPTPTMPTPTMPTPTAPPTTKQQGSCAKFGCNITYKRGNVCQCDSECWKFTEGCCSDWNSLCADDVRIREEKRCTSAYHIPVVWL